MVPVVHVPRSALLLPSDSTVAGSNTGQLGNPEKTYRDRKNEGYYSPTGPCSPIIRNRPALEQSFTIW